MDSPRIERYENGARLVLIGDVGGFDADALHFAAKELLSVEGECMVDAHEVTRLSPAGAQVLIALEEARRTNGGAVRWIYSHELWQSSLRWYGFGPPEVLLPREAGADATPTQERTPS